MECAQIRDAFTQGTVPPPALVQAHLAECAHCRELFEHDAELGRSLALTADARSSVAFPEQLFDQIADSVKRETGLRAWLRSRPSKLRFALAMLSVLVAVGVGGVLALRPDFSAYPRARLVLIAGVYLGLVSIALRKELFSALQRRSPSEQLGLLVAALGLPFLVALAPATEASNAHGPEGALACFVYGALLTLPTGALLWALGRDDRLSMHTVCASAAALGLSANLLLELHCANGNLAHVLLGHASLGVAWLCLWLLTRRMSRAAA